MLLICAIDGDGELEVEKLAVKITKLRVLPMRTEKWAALFTIFQARF